MLKVLLIEDSLTLQYEMIQYLEEYGAEVIHGVPNAVSSTYFMYACAQ